MHSHVTSKVTLSRACAQDALNGEFLGTSLENLELTDDVSWEDLTEEQQRAFQKAAAEGRLSSLVEVLAVYVVCVFYVCVCVSTAEGRLSSLVKVLAVYVYVCFTCVCVCLYPHVISLTLSLSPTEYFYVCTRTFSYVFNACRYGTLGGYIVAW
jgi:hypothetical protein